MGEAEAAWQRSFQVAAEEGKLYRLSLSSLSLAHLRAIEGRIEEALALIEEAKRVNPGWRESPLPEWESMIHWLVGNFPAALLSARQAEVSNPGPLSRRRALGACFAALSAVECDETDAAGRYLSKAQAAYGERDWGFYRDYSLYAEAMLAWRQAGPSEALAGLRRVAGRLLGLNTFPLLALVLVDLIQVATLDGDVAEAAGWAARLQQAATRIDRELYRALSAIEWAWAHLAEGTAVAAAEAAREALERLAGMHHPFYVARAEEALGRSLSGINRTAALEAYQRAAAGFEECGATWRRAGVIREMSRLGGAGRRARAQALGPGSLTPREREVARLAARGHTAREIGAQLFIGERTVESYLGRVYAKLGVRSKLDLIRRVSEFEL